MKREFLINIIFLLAVNLLIKPFYVFGIDIGVQNTVPEEDYGIYFAFFNFTFLFQIITDFGIQNYNNRNLSQNRHLLDKYFPNMLMLKAFLGLIYLFVVAIAAYIVGYHKIYVHLLAIIALNQLLTSLLLYLRTNISGLGFYRIDSIISITDRLLLIIICGVLLWSPLFKSDFKIEWFALAQSFALLATCTLCILIIRKRIQQWKFSVNWPLLLVLLRQTWPYALSVFLMSAYNRIDGVMIERMLEDGKVEASLYASAYRLFEASNMIGFLFASLLLPIFSRMLKDKSPMEELVTISFKMILAGALVLVAGISFYRAPIMEALYVHGSTYSGDILLFLMASFVAVGGTYIIGTLLVANDNLKQLNYVFLAGLILNIVLNSLLIPVYKAQGAAFATCLTQLLVFSAEIYLVYRCLSIHPRLFAPVRLILFLGFNLALGYTIHTFLPVNWLGKFVITLFVGGLSAFLFRLIDIRLLSQLFNKA